MKLYTFIALIGIASSVKINKEWVDSKGKEIPRGPDGVQNGFGYLPPDDEKHGGPLHDQAYKREIPERFTGPTSDRLMHSIISKYAVDKRDEKTGKPTGQLYVDRAGAEALAREVVATHLKKTGKELDDYVTHNLTEAWARWDVNQTGWVEAERIPTLLRAIINDPVAGFGLQMQTGSK